MPIMELYAPEEPDFLPLNVMAYMLFPSTESEPSRKAYLAREWAKYVVMRADERGQRNVPIEVLRDVLGVDRETVQEASDSLVKRGCVAGELFTYLVRLSCSGIEPSLNKATHMADEYFVHAVNEVGTKISSSHASTRKAWYAFNPASHLWAAFLHLHANGADLPLIGLKLPALAEKFSALAPTITDSDNQTVVFSDQELWTLPSTIELPEVEVRILELGPEEERRLKTLLKRSISK
jgi:hypothetical protein